MEKLQNLFEVLKVSTKLGLTSFGGPIAHLGYFYNEYILKRKWMDEKNYLDLVALCQFLPGPASSQIGIGIGVTRAGLWGGIIAWFGFTMPSVIMMVLFAFLLKGFNFGAASWMNGLKVMAVAIVAHAVITMGQKLASDRTKATIAIISASVLLIWQTAFTQVAVILISGILGLFIYRKVNIPKNAIIQAPIHKCVAFTCLGLFFGLLVFLPILGEIIPLRSLAIVDSFYRSGSLVFGGGHVVLPLLERAVVPTGWVSAEDFMAGYGATQAVPGPLFTFSAYLGTIAYGIPGAILATLAVFLPSFLLVVGVLPFWNTLRKYAKVQGALISINASVVGILLAALYHPLWTNAIHSSKDFVLGSVLFGMLYFWKLPPWLVVIAGALGGIVMNKI